MKQLGFKNVHALEPLKDFADDAKKKEVYSKILVESIGFGKETSAETSNLLVVLIYVH